MVTKYYWFSKNKDDNADTFFLHGLTADHRMFDYQITYFEDDYSILVWGAPAHGKSRTFETFSFGENSLLSKRNLVTDYGK